ncbi:MAG TPA: ABC transporter permease [Planctomycetota bacterium]|nr:ABC transporter permease [Planctomycetota bacterium]
MNLFVEHFRELWRYRVLVESLVWREVKARYRGSFLGFFWTLLNPLFTLVVYRIIFTKVMRLDVPNYAVFFFVGFLAWLWLATTLTNATISILQGGSLITRVCMPPQVLPMVQVLSNLVNFLLALPIALAAASCYQLYPSPALLALPVVIAIQLVFLYGTALLLATYTVSFRDIQFLVQNLMQPFFLATPIAYPISAAEGVYGVLIRLNPATSLIVPYQQILHERVFPSPEFLGIGALWAAAVLFLGVRAFELRRNAVVEEI